MNKTQFLLYHNKLVKIIFSDGFVLIGVITDVFDDCIQFKTKQKVSLIRFEMVYSISEEGS